MSAIDRREYEAEIEREVDEMIRAAEEGPMYLEDFDDSDDETRRVSDPPKP